MSAPREIALGRHSDLKTRERLVLDIDGVEVGVFFIGSQIRAYLNLCPHMGGPACQGKLMPRTLEAVSDTGRGLGLTFSKDETHIVCPWHGYEFDVMTGRHPVDPRMALRPVPVKVVDGEVYVTISGGRE